MKVLLTTCLLFALLPAVASLLCQQSAGKKEACNNPMVIEFAKDEDSSFRLLGNIIIEVVTHNVTVTVTVSENTFVNSKYWREGTYFLATEENNSIFGKVEVCQTDMCNKKNISLPRRSELPESGWECPACITLDSDRCKAQKTISCRGNETMCVHAGLAGKGPKDVEYNGGFRGCVTPNVCNIPTGEMDTSGGMLRNNITHLKCTSASIRSGRIR